MISPDYSPAENPSPPTTYVEDGQVIDAIRRAYHPELASSTDDTKTPARSPHIRRGSLILDTLTTTTTNEGEPETLAHTNG